MYDKLISTAQSVLEGKFEGVEITNSKVVLTSDNEGCVEFICNSKTYRLDFERKSDTEFDLSDEAVEVENSKAIELEIESEEEAEMNEDATSSSEEESEEEVSEDIVEEKGDYTKQIEEMKGMYESKMSEMQAQIDELKMCTDKLTQKMETETVDNQKSEEAEIAAEETDEKAADESVVENVKTAKPFYGSYADIIENNITKFI